MFRCLTVAAALALATPTPTPTLAQDPHGIHAGMQPTASAGMDRSRHIGHSAQPTASVVTVPADGAMLMRPPSQVSITFAHPMRLTGVTIRAEGQADIDVPISDAPASATQSTALPALAPDTYRLAWTAEGSDGHTMTGTIGFMVH